MGHPKFAPREVFEEILEWSVIPTFDLLLRYGDSGFIVLKRKIEPYKNVWALPGLRMYKGETIEDTLKRIAKNELGINVDTTNKVLVGQYVGKFKTEKNRQDISTCYLIELAGDEHIVMNKDHFSEMMITKEIPKRVGAMYAHYLRLGLENIR